MTTEAKPVDYTDKWGDFHCFCCCCWEEAGDIRCWSCGCYGEKSHWKDAQPCKEHGALPHDD